MFGEGEFYLFGVFIFEYGVVVVFGCLDGVVEVEYCYFDFVYFLELFDFGIDDGWVF